MTDVEKQILANQIAIMEALTELLPSGSFRIAKLNDNLRETRTLTKS